MPKAIPMDLSKAEQEKTDIELFSELTYSDMWSDASLLELIKYLRGSKYLRIPQEWRSHIPSHL